MVVVVVVVDPRRLGLCRVLAALRGQNLDGTLDLEGCAVVQASTNRLQSLRSRILLVKKGPLLRTRLVTTTDPLPVVLVLVRCYGQFAWEAVGIVTEVQSS